MSGDDKLLVNDSFISMHKKKKKQFSFHLSIILFPTSKKKWKEREMILFLLMVHLAYRLLYDAS